MISSSQMPLCEAGFNVFFALVSNQPLFPVSSPHAGQLSKPGQCSCCNSFFVWFAVLFIANTNQPAHLYHFHFCCYLSFSIFLPEREKKECNVSNGNVLSEAARGRASVAFTHLHETETQYWNRNLCSKNYIAVFGQAWRAGAINCSDGEIHQA